MNMAPVDITDHVGN